MSNIDPQTVSSFGEEWLRFDQSGMSITEAQKAFESYFAVFPWADLRPDAEGSIWAAEAVVGHVG